jgi:chromosome segregation ATPase
MANMPDTQPDGPRYLRQGVAPPGETTASVDVTELLAKLAEQTEELAEARVGQKHAQAELKRKARQLTAERKAHSETQKRLEADCAELQAECDQAAGESRELKARLTREHNARTAAEADLKRVQERLGSLQHQLQIAWARLKEEGGEEEQQPRPWWSRLGS